MSLKSLSPGTEVIAELLSGQHTGTVTRCAKKMQQDGYYVYINDFGRDEFVVAGGVKRLAGGGQR